MTRLLLVEAARFGVVIAFFGWVAAMLIAVGAP